MTKFRFFENKPLLISAVLALALHMFASYAVHAGEVLASGTFVGKSDHITTGQVTIEKDGGKTFVILGADFSLDGAPDPKVGFYKGGKFVKGSLIAPLQSKTGRQVYEVPASVDVSAFDGVTIWCEKFSVPLGLATLN